MESLIYTFINRHIKSLLLILFMVAVIYPLLIVIIEKPPLPPHSDQLDFNQIAIGLLNGRGIHSNAIVADNIKLPNTRHPLYSFFIAFIYFFTNNSIIAVKIIQILLNGLTCIIIYLIAKELFKDRLIGFGAGMVWALYPLSISFSISLLSETFLVFLLAVSVLFLLRSWQNPNLKNGFFSGLFLGLTALNKSIIFAFIPFLFLWLILFSKDRLTSKLKNFLIILIFTILTISPWLIRNYIALNRFLPISTGSGVAFYRYNNEKTLELVNTPLRASFAFTEEQKKKMSALPEPEIDKYLYDLAWQYIRSHPKDFLKIRLTELCSFWHLWPASPKRFTEYYLQLKQLGLTTHNVHLKRFLDLFKGTYLLYFCKILYHLPYNILFLGMFVSLISSFRKNREEWRKSLLLFFLIIAINAVYILYHGSDRYRLPIDPYIFILGMHGVVSLYEGLKRRRR